MLAGPDLGRVPRLEIAKVGLVVELVGGLALGRLDGVGPRIGDLARLGLRAMAGGAIASFLTATIAGIIA